MLSPSHSRQWKRPAAVRPGGERLDHGVSSGLPVVGKSHVSPHTCAMKTFPLKSWPMAASAAASAVATAGFGAMGAPRLPIPRGTVLSTVRIVLRTICSGSPQGAGCPVAPRPPNCTGPEAEEPMWTNVGGASSLAPIWIWPPRESNAKFPRFTSAEKAGWGGGPAIPGVAATRIW